MDKEDLFSPKQLEFIIYSTATWNLAHGSVRSGKTVGTLFRFLQACTSCPDSQIFMLGHTSDTIYENAIRLIFESPQFEMFKNFCTWKKGDRVLLFQDKTIKCIGAKDTSSVAAIQGKTMSLVYCDEMTLYPLNVIDMLNTRLSNPWSMGFASMNPSHPEHIIKKWIDKAESGDDNYYSLHFTLDDNPFVEEAYKDRVKNSLSGLFYKRNYLGLWCLAEGAVFDFFDKDLHITEDPPTAAEYFIAGLDYGTVNPFACVIVGVSTGKWQQTGRRWWVEKEYFWDPKVKGRQKINTEFADDIQEFLEPYGVTKLYIDPSASAIELELKRRRLPVAHANNDVQFGISYMASEIQNGNFTIGSHCKNLIREIEGYVWDSREAAKGKDVPLKKDDHLVDSVRYVIASHKIPIPYEDPHDEKRYLRERFRQSGRRNFRR